ncbi:hypothetical protein GCM10027037_10460 [Mucilaginibacter koreensis]
MTPKFLNIALGVALSAAALSASAQKKYTEGVATYNVSTAGQNVEAKTYFKGDSSAYSFSQGPASIKIIGTANSSFLAVLVDVPIASIKKAAVATPAELEDAKAQEPKFSFTPTNETKQISGFNCKKVMVKDAKDNASYAAWVTTDISAPSNTLSKYFAGAGGFPVQFTTVQMGRPTEVTLKSIAEQTVPKGTFAIPADFDKITLEELKSMSGGGR